MGAVFRAPSPVWDRTTCRNHPSLGLAGTSEVGGGGAQRKTRRLGRAQVIRAKPGKSGLLHFLGQHSLTSTTVGLNFNIAPSLEELLTQTHRLREATHA